MKGFCAFVGFFIGMILGGATGVSGFAVIFCLLGACIGYDIGDGIVGALEKKRHAKEEYESHIMQEEYERNKRNQRKAEAQELARKYPEATKFYFRYHWGITKSYISIYDITDEKVDILLGHKYSYEQEEQRQKNAHRLKAAAEREAIFIAERETAERKRREEEKERQRREAEIRNLPTTLYACVSSWNSHINSTLKHKYFFNYYSYYTHKNDATSSMWNTWKTVWNFKNDPSKNISSYEHTTALNKVIDLVEGELRRAFGSKTEYLTLVCLTASTQRKTELRFKKFAEIVCKDLKMNNAYPYIRVAGEGGAMHEGGTGVTSKSYDSSFFKGKYIVLFDDVRTSGNSLERECRVLENYGAKVICAITIAQTVRDY